MQALRYHPALVVLHWLLAAFLLFALGMGTFVLQQIPNASPDKLGALRGHMIAGMLIGVLMLVRLLVRHFSARPARLGTGMAWADRLSAPVHGALYLLVFVMVASGFGIAWSTGLPEIVFGGAGALPASFDGLTPRAVHAIVAKLLALLIALHVAAGFFHAFVRRDGALGRMGFGRRARG